MFRRIHNFFYTKDGYITDRAWNLTIGIMLAGVLANAILLLLRLC